MYTITRPVCEGCCFSSDLGMIIVSRWLVAVCFGHGCFVHVLAYGEMATSSHERWKWDPGWLIVVCNCELVPILQFGSVVLEALFTPRWLIVV